MTGEAFKIKKQAQNKDGRLNAFGDLLRTLKQFVEAAILVLKPAHSRVHRANCCANTDFQHLEDQVKLCKQSITDSRAFNDHLATNRGLRQPQKDFRGTQCVGQTAPPSTLTQSASHSGVTHLQDLESDPLARLPAFAAPVTFTFKLT